MSIPDWVVDLASFRLWVHSTEVPEKVRTCYLAGEIYVDLSREQIFSHNQVKQQFNVVIGRLVKASETGLYFPDGVLFSKIQADLASQPDGMFVGMRVSIEGESRSSKTPMAAARNVKARQMS